jgi:hypothetical protein
MLRLPNDDSRFAMEAVGDDISIKLAAGDDQTIGDQYKGYESVFNELVDLFSNTGECEGVLSICIRAYDYIPEINFPSELVSRIAQLGASIDVDVINMIE